MDLSLRGRIWELSECDESVAHDLMIKHSIPMALARILAARNVTSVEHFLNPLIKNYMPDPYCLQNMDIAVARIVRAIINDETLALFGDYDVDGATSCALMYKFFSSLGIKTIVHIPDRFIEGYGPNINAFSGFIEKKASLCITLDCGTAAIDEGEWAQQHNLDWIIIDHHMGGENLPKALAIVNPNCQGDTSGLDYLAAVGVAFMVVVAVNSQLPSTRALPKTELFNLLDLVALGTVCDVMELRGLNRALVAAGLRVMEKGRNVGLKALLGALGLEGKTLNARHMGYMLGPRINAGGRLGESELGFNLLTACHIDAARELALRANILNQQRALEEDSVLLEAISMIDEKKTENSLIMVVGSGWNIGVIGIVAGRLKEIYNAPVAVVALDEDGIGKASCRSVKGFNFGGSIIDAKQAGLLVKGGGHALAGGFTVERANLVGLRDFFEQDYRKQLVATQDLQIARRRRYDAIVPVKDLTAKFLNEIMALEPCGQGNYQPYLMLKGVRLRNLQIRQEKHAFFVIDQQDYIKGAMFRLGTEELMHLHNISSAELDVIGQLGFNEYAGNRMLQFVVEDILCPEKVA